MQVMGLLENIDRSRFAVSLCLFNRGLESMERDVAAYAEEVHFLDFRWRRFPVVFPKLVGYLRDGRFDVVHAHLAWADLIGRLAAWFAGVPVRVTTEHGKGLWKSPFQVMLEKGMNRITDMRICVSRDVLRIRNEREGTPGGKLVYIPNGVDCDAFAGIECAKEKVMAEFDWDPADPLVVSVGRIVEEKNYPLLVEAVALLKKRIPRARCVIAGDGGCRGEVESAIERFGLNDSVKLPGSRSDVAVLLCAADLFALSSIREGLPVSLLEAMAAGTPVVSTNVGGIPEAVTDGVSALLVPPGDSAALAFCMERVLSDDSLSRDLASEAIRTVRERFSIGSIASRVEGIYGKLLAEKKKVSCGM